MQSWLKTKLAFMFRLAVSALHRWYISTSSWFLVQFICENVSHSTWPFGFVCTTCFRSLCAEFTLFVDFNSDLTSHVYAGATNLSSSQINSDSKSISEFGLFSDWEYSNILKQFSSFYAKNSSKRHSSTFSITSVQFWWCGSGCWLKQVWNLEKKCKA